jgi:hypothetical protein
MFAQSGLLVMYLNKVVLILDLSWFYCNYYATQRKYILMNFPSQRIFYQS